MRTIKFRAKDIETGNWRYGDLVTYCGATESQICDWNTDLGLYDIEADTIGQFIGLCDMEGKGIYEGDVLMVEGIKTNRYSKVWWNPEKFTFYIGHSPLDAYIIDDGRLREFRIAGNIYDNPELKETLV